MPDLRVAALHVYPIKSLRGVALDEARIERRGFALDRRWMLVDEAGMFMTQREHPRMALLDVGIASDHLTVSAAGAEPLTVPLRPEGPRRTVTVWKSTCEAVVVGDDASRWLSARLGVACALVFMPEDVERRVNPEYAAPDDLVGFADGYPFLLATLASLEDLNRRLPVPVTMKRFRPNIVVSGSTPFAEDDWSHLVIGDVPFRVAKSSERCAITTVDPETAETGVEPLRTLATFRKRGDKVMFGQNLIQRGEGVVRVGDRVTVLAALP